MNSSEVDESLRNSTFISSEQIVTTHYDKLSEDISILVLYSISFVLGLFGNSLVCYVVFNRKITTTTYILIGNLAISDILGSIAVPSNLFIN